MFPIEDKLNVQVDEKVKNTECSLCKYKRLICLHHLSDSLNSHK